MERAPYLTAVELATLECGLMEHQLVSMHTLQIVFMRIIYVHMHAYYQKATEFQKTSLKASHRCYVCMICNTPTPSHPSTADEAWHWQKHVLRTG